MDKKATHSPQLSGKYLVFVVDRSCLYKYIHVDRPIRAGGHPQFVNRDKELRHV